MFTQNNKIKLNKKLKTNLEFTNYLNDLIIKEKNLEEKLKLIKLASFWTGNNALGIYYNYKLEKELCKIAENISSSPPEKKLNKYLIIMTFPHYAGGHTRLVENLINSFPKNTFDLLLTENDIVIIEKDIKIPESLSRICIEKNCNIIKSSFKDDLDKAKEIREKAAGYKKIILFTHPEDYIPLLAFGIRNWKVPILTYNHADHKTWLGISISDVIIDMSSQASKYTKSCRLARESYIIPIPIKKEEKNPSLKNKIRKKLNIPDNAVVIYSAGSYQKYLPSHNADFRVVVDKILSNIKNSYVVIVGVNPDSKLWKKLKDEYKNRLILIKSLPYEEYKNYYNIADICIDSIPEGGFTVLLEAAIREIPIVYIKNREFYPDPIAKIGIDYDQLIPYIKNLIKTDFKSNIDKNLLKEHYIESFYKKFKLLLEKDIKHSLNIVQNPVLCFDDYSRHILMYIMPKPYLQIKLILNLSLKNKLKIATKSVFLRYVINKTFDKMIQKLEMTKK